MIYRKRSCDAEHRPLTGVSESFDGGTQKRFQGFKPRENEPRRNRCCAGGISYDEGDGLTLAHCWHQPTLAMITGTFFLAKLTFHPAVGRVVRARCCLDFRWKALWNLTADA